MGHVLETQLSCPPSQGRCPPPTPLDGAGQIGDIEALVGVSRVAARADMMAPTVPVDAL